MKTARLHLAGAREQAEEKKDMDLDALDAREEELRRVTEESTGLCDQCCFPIETGFVKQVWNKVHHASAEIKSFKCARCRHPHCPVCEEGSAAKQFSDYWICHRCKELNRRLFKFT